MAAMADGLRRVCIRRKPYWCPSNRDAEGLCRAGRAFRAVLEVQRSRNAVGPGAVLLNQHGHCHLSGQDLPEHPEHPPGLDPASRGRAVGRTRATAPRRSRSIRRISPAPLPRLRRTESSLRNGWLPWELLDGRGPRWKTEAFSIPRPIRPRSKYSADCLEPPRRTARPSCPGPQWLSSEGFKRDAKTLRSASAATQSTPRSSASTSSPVAADSSSASIAAKRPPPRVDTQPISSS